MSANVSSGWPLWPASPPKRQQVPANWDTCERDRGQLNGRALKELHTMLIQPFERITFAFISNTYIAPPDGTLPFERPARQTQAHQTVGPQGSLLRL